MKILSRNKEAHQQLQVLSLPRIKKKSLTVSTAHLPTSKAKVDIRKSINRSSSLFQIQHKKSQVFNLQELNKKSMVDPTVKHEHGGERKKIILNQQTIDLWKLKHHQISPAKRSELGNQDNQFISMQMGQKHSPKANSLSHELPNYLWHRKNSLRQKLKNEGIPEQFNVKKVVYEKGSKKKMLKVIRKDKESEKLPRKTPIPKQLKIQQTPKKAQIVQYNPTKWETGHKNIYQEQQQNQIFLDKKQSSILNEVNKSFESDKQ